MKTIKHALIAILVLDIATYAIDNLDRYVAPLALCGYAAIAISASLWLLHIRSARRSLDTPS